jgi:hypothetical protein
MTPSIEGKRKTSEWLAKGLINPSPMVKNYEVVVFTLAPADPNH